MEASRLEALYRQYAPLLQARARRIVDAEADDVVQEVFVRLLQKDDQIENLMGWMYTTTTNLCLDRLRHASRRDSDWQQEVRRDATDGKSGDIERLLTTRDTCRRLLARLDRKIQQVAVLVYLDEMTHEEAAHTLGISRKTVGERLQRLQQLAGKMVQRWTR